MGGAGVTEGRLHGMDLFSGIGGLTAALERWVRPIAYCESDPYCQRVLLSRMHDGSLPTAPIWDDVCTLDGRDLAGSIDIIYGGFPCQDISLAGNGGGLGGERSGLYSEIERLVGEVRPLFVFLENVPAIRTRGAATIVGGLADLGYDCRWGVLSAHDVGAPHLRERWWLLAHRHRLESVPDTNSELIRIEEQRQERGWDDVRDCWKPEPRDDGSTQTMADSGSWGWGERLVLGEPERKREAAISDWWAVEPDVGRVAHGVSKRMDRLRALGNSVVPQQAREAFIRLSWVERQ